MSLHSDPLNQRVSPYEAGSLSELLFSLEIDNNWDAIAFTDGSGSGPIHPGGYAACVVYRRKSGIQIITGALSACSSQHAEVRAVYELITQLHRQKAGQKRNGFQCHLVTDSKYVATRLDKINHDPSQALVAKSHTLQWVGIQHASRYGIKVYPHHIGRNANPLMELADDLSRKARLSTEEYDKRVDDCLAECDTNFKLYAN